MNLISASNPDIYAVPLQELEEIFDLIRDEDPEKRKLNLQTEFREALLSNPVIAWALGKDSVSPVTPNHDCGNFIVYDRVATVWSHQYEGTKGTCINTLIEYIDGFM